VLGPVFLLAPISLLALRTHSGRLVLAAAACLGVPWLFNAGARFLLPPAVLMAAALCRELPRPALWATMAAHALLSWPAVVPRYAWQHVWRLDGIPFRAIVNPGEYLRPRADYQIGQLLEGSTRPGDRIFALVTVPRAYTTRETLEFWHSTTADALADGLRVAALNTRDPLYRWGAAFAARPASGVRFRLPASHRGEWCVHEAEFRSGDQAVYTNPHWRGTATQNHWQAGLALDGNPASRWRTREAIAAGTTFDVVFDRMVRVTNAALLSHTPVYALPMEVWLRAADGNWAKAADARAVQLPPHDLRRAAVQAVKAAGFNYILAPAAGQGMAPLGQAMTAEPAAWGLEVAGRAGSAYLFRIRAGQAGT
jgi:hypothetical protein